MRGALTGVHLGTYDADTAHGAASAMRREAGYADDVAAAHALGVERTALDDDLVITEVAS